MVTIDLESFAWTIQEPDAKFDNGLTGNICGNSAYADFKGANMYSSKDKNNALSIVTYWNNNSNNWADSVSNDKWFTEAFTSYPIIKLDDND